MIGKLFYLLFVVFLNKAEGEVKVDTKTKQFVDEYGRTRIFHGVNAVYKIAPWHPKLHGFDSENTLSKIDSYNLKRWGLNIVRLGVMWPGVEPGQRGEYNQTYLDNIKEIVDTLANDDIYVILDFHQDICHRKFCGEGVPDYVYEICKAAEPEGTLPFPHPITNETLPLDENGDPTLESCLERFFVQYYLTYEVSGGFQCLYDNKGGLWDAFAGFWKTVAARFSDSPKVIGYELINEPFAGDVYNNPEVLIHKYTEQKYLQPLYEHVNDAIRTVDDQKLIFFERFTHDYTASGFTAGPGGPEYNDRQALAYHVYCPFDSGDATPKMEVTCAKFDDFFLSLRRDDAERLGVGMIMTEFGAVEDFAGDLIELEKTAQLMDKYQQSWMYWQFKYYQDITTETPVGESLYDENGEVSAHKLRILSRTYPIAVAGTLKGFEFDVKTGLFSMEYSLSILAGEERKLEESDAYTSVVYYNKDMHYPTGVKVELSGSGKDFIEVICPQGIQDAGYLKLTQSKFSEEDVLMTVKLSKCVSDCTCRF